MSAKGTKQKVNCRTCQLTRGAGNGKLRARIYHAYYDRQPGDETLGQIGQEVGITQQSMHNHCKRHLRVRSEKLEEAKKVKTIEKIRATIAKETELTLDHDDLIPLQDYEKTLDAILASGYDQLMKQDKQISITQLLAAVKIKADYMTKRRGQDTEILKTMYRMAQSGKQDTDSSRPTGLADTGPDKPNPLYKQTVGDAAA